MDERTRHELHQRLDDLLGVDLAVALMSSLPPTGWGDVATRQDIVLLKSDLVELEQRLDLRFEARLERGLREQTRTLFFGLLAANATFVALALAALKLA